MLRYLSKTNTLPKALEELLAVCILEDVPFASVASKELLEEVQDVLDSLTFLQSALQRELALSSLEEHFV